jgi:hypothetical protein
LAIGHRSEHEPILEGFAAGEGQRVGQLDHAAIVPSPRD